MSSDILSEEEAIVSQIMAQLRHAGESSLTLLEQDHAEMVVTLNIKGPGRVQFNLMSGEVIVPQQGNVYVFPPEPTMRQLESALHQVVQRLVNDFLKQHGITSEDGVLTVLSPNAARLFRLPPEEKQYAQRLATAFQTLASQLASENKEIIGLDQARELIRVVQELSAHPASSYQKRGNANT
jgi:hypothetical protein